MKKRTIYAATALAAVGFIHNPLRFSGAKAIVARDSSLIGYRSPVPFGWAYWAESGGVEFIFDPLGLVELCDG